MRAVSFGEELLATMGVAADDERRVAPLVDVHRRAALRLPSARGGVPRQFRPDRGPRGIAAHFVRLREALEALWPVCLPEGGHAADGGAALDTPFDARVERRVEEQLALGSPQRRLRAIALEQPHTARGVVVARVGRQPLHGQVVSGGGKLHAVRSAYTELARGLRNRQPEAAAAIDKDVVGPKA
eukprot:scaffold58266_cov63-Phaeocystis_antarctica.AAC.2